MKMRPVHGGILSITIINLSRISIENKIANNI